LWLLMQD